ncbi:serotriflin-like [Eleutherodactylus coqui]|uniref:serotriflin-like n=1 Tax=Eleutherodactylus coqui TaxID=57060 RepID=UPI003461C7C7
MWIHALCFSILFMVLEVQIQAYRRPQTYKTLAAISTDNPDIQKEIVDLTNKLRRSVEPSARNMVEVSWNEEAAKTALRYAETCAMKHSNVSQRNITDCSCGENLFMSSYRANWTEVLMAFFNEYKDYDYTNNTAKTPNAMIGHYTQLVWYISSKIGCAVAKCLDHPKYKYFYVCHQCPMGNIIGEWPYKEGPPCGDCPQKCNNGLCTNPCKYQDNYKNCKNITEYCGIFELVDAGCEASCNCEDEIW